MTAVIWLVCGTLLSGCVPFVDVVKMDKVSLEQRASTAKVQVFPSGMYHSEKFDFVGPVEGYSCKHLTTDKPASESDATEQMRYKAMLMGANAVMDYSCTKNGTDTLGTNCWNTVQCGGTAILIKDGQP